MTKHLIGEQLANSLPLSTIGEPFTIDEIDKHPDAQRIWRTLQEVCYCLEDDLSDYTYSQGHAEGYDEGYREGFQEGSNTKVWQEGLSK